ncbi:uncharacterized protein TRIADDRAFT_30948 [Trichoplax adhaerens]|uniref:Major facilitator superfamily (MFS) profile domain-containing protein n=1 Tax=Trichoplax adhaerens TaxID=10228 RepID=B3S7Z3_TRIAD|nr:hypothetical protein TRIADDRAFT_30948 [Trichoplax adhaerens]EDV21100.1 hypothetical protein TRIADDRAFT_30948 [Trichoplax adhaerens]|eukprot:XP_002116430.1 hypothetical protein TRIADDRAFT_30948 [Trichoplax adhaerens]
MATINEGKIRSKNSYQSKLDCRQRFSFGVGHVLNDLCASMWFSYLLVYMHSVIGFSHIHAGILMLIGQVADGICTPIIGYESDRTADKCYYGRRKSWHLLGVCCVIVSYAFVFNKCFVCSAVTAWPLLIYYTPFVILFQFGWAATQISHLSLIPELTDDENERVGLNAIRYAFTVISNIYVYLVAFMLLRFHGGKYRIPTLTISVGNKRLKVVYTLFNYLVGSVLGIGLIAAIIFHVGTKEKRQHEINCRTTQERYKKKTWIDWLKSSLFYRVAVLYMCSRLIVNITQVYIPLYVIKTLHLHKMHIALVPLTVYVSGFLVSLVLKPINYHLGRKITFFLALVMCGGFCCCIYLLPASHAYVVYAGATMLGVGGTSLLVTVLSMTADLISKNVESGAFVYGAMSFTDKLSNGIAVIIIQSIHPCAHIDNCANSAAYYRSVLTYVPGGAAAVAFLCLCTMMYTKMPSTTDG